MGMAPKLLLNPLWPSRALCPVCVRPASRPEPFHWHVQTALSQPWDVNIPVFLPNVLGRLT